jgi:hypothetical protein
MGAHSTQDLNIAGKPGRSGFTWLGGGDIRDIGERHERSAHVIAGLVVLLTALLGAVVVGLALGESTTWPTVIIVSIAMVAAVPIAVLGRAITSGPVVNGRNIAGRAAVAVAVGLVLGELAAVVLFAGGSQRVLDEQAARRAESTPAVQQVAAQLDQSRQTRASLVNAVDQAQKSRDQALVVARCEYNPRPDCPQTRITGDPGEGPETQTANGFLADAQRELDTVTADRDNRLPGLDAQIAQQEQVLAADRKAAIGAAVPGLGARWVAMNTYTAASGGALLLRLLGDMFFIFLGLLPLILKVWRGETTQDRRVAARAERERAELDAETAIAVKRAEVRAAAEALWAEQQLESARLAVAAQTEIEREQQRQRVFEAVGAAPVLAQSRRIAQQLDGDGADDDLYLPIAAEAEAASRSMRQLPAAGARASAQSDAGARASAGSDAGARASGTGPLADVKVAAAQADNLPVAAQTSSAPAVPAHQTENLPEPIVEDSRSGLPGIPDVTQAAARWIRPFVPPIVVQAFDVATHPLRSARQVFEEVEEINLTLNRTRKVASYTEETGVPYAQPYYEEAAAPPVTHMASASRVYPEWPAPTGYQPPLYPTPGYPTPGYPAPGYPAYQVPPAPQQWAVGPTDQLGEIPGREGTPELPGPTGPRQLPPGS